MVVADLMMEKLFASREKNVGFLCLLSQAATREVRERRGEEKKISRQITRLPCLTKYA